MESPGEFERFEQAVKLFDEATKRLPNTQGSLSNTQTTTIDAGNKALWFAVWLATTCCIVMFIMSLEQRDKIDTMQVQLTDVSRKLDVAQDKLSIVLQWAPSLRDEVNKEMKDKEKSK